MNRRATIEKALPPLTNKSVHSDPAHLEDACLRMLHQMAAIGQSMALLSSAKRRFAGTHNPLTALVRLAGEGLIYVNYALTAETNPVLDLMASDFFWREAQCDFDRVGKWRRGGKQHLSDAPGTFSSPDDAKCALLKGEPEGRCDDLEVFWLQVAIYEVDALLTAAERLTLSARSQRLATLRGLRKLWNDIRGIVSARRGTIEHSSWKRREDQWQEMSKWAFGIKPMEAMRRGKLGERLVKAQGSGQANAEDMERLVRVGCWERGSELSHFSAARVYMDNPAFETFALGTTAIFLLWAVDLLSGKYGWADSLKFRTRGLREMLP